MVSGYIGLLLHSLLLSHTGGSVTVPDVTLDDLLNEMVDLERLTRMPDPYFTTRQSSSYDRKSKDPQTEWFANADAGNFIRDETVDGRIEHVMADLKGPGAVMRIWTANPAGVLRMYFDGEATPRVEGRFADLVNGRIQPWADPFGYMSSRGGNIYFPFPYSRSLKVTVDNSDNNASRSLYYHVTYRQYEGDTAVESFPREFDSGHWRFINLTGQRLAKLEPKDASIAVAHVREDVVLAPGAVATILEEKRGGAIRELRVVLQPGDESEGGWGDPNLPHNMLRTVLVECEFDGKVTVRAPLGDFFANAPAINQFQTLPMGATSAQLVSRFVMPYQNSAKIRLLNVGKSKAPMVTHATITDYRWDRNSLYFHAQWIAERGRTRPMRDMEFLHSSGRGQFVGSHLHMANPTSAWWGEGDEKMYIDGESFPSTFGTGTEDYYGYAWCDPTPFVRAYHAQPRCDGPGNRGQTSVIRWHVADRMPYSKSFRFDMELWHWKDCEVTAARTVFWYADANSTGPRAVDKSFLLPPEVAKPKPIPGVIEGEDLKVASKTGEGVVEKQGGFEDLSGEAQLWWRDGKLGDVLALEVPVPADGTYELIGHFCYANDYGIHEIEIAGMAKDYDFFGDLHWKSQTLGQFHLAAGVLKVRIRIKGTNPKAIPRHMFGVDYFRLVKR